MSADSDPRAMPPTPDLAALDPETRDALQRVSAAIWKALLAADAAEREAQRTDTKEGQGDAPR